MPSIFLTIVLHQLVIKMKGLIGYTLLLKQNGLKFKKKIEFYLRQDLSPLDSSIQMLREFPGES